MAVFDEQRRNNDAFYAEIKDADIIIDGYVHFGKKEIDAWTTARSSPSSPPATTRPTSTTRRKRHCRLLHP